MVIRHSVKSILHRSVSPPSSCDTGKSCKRVSKSSTLVLKQRSDSHKIFRVNQRVMCVAPKAMMDGEFRNKNKAPERSMMAGS
jgi:hypothetical protein